MLYDIYMSYSERDTSKVKELTDLMHTLKDDIRIFTTHQEINAEKAFQDDMYEVMIKCRRFVVIPSTLKKCHLDPAYGPFDRLFMNQHNAGKGHLGTVSKV